MRVLHVIPSVSAHHGGPSVALPLMVQALQDIGVAVDVATTDDDGPGKRLNVPLGVPVAYGSGSIFYFRKQTEFYKVATSLRKWLKANVTNYDVVHVHALFSYTSDMAASVARKAGIPYVIRPLGVLNRYGMTQRRALLKRFSFRWIEGPLLRDAAAVHFTSQKEQAEAMELGVELKPWLLPIGMLPVDPPASGFTRSDKHQLLFLGRINPVKNLENLIKAWGQLAPTLPDWELVVAGSGEAAYVASLKSLAGELGITSSIKWTGQVTGKAKNELLHGCSAFVLPSFSENFGISAAEALMAGKPCVVSKGVGLGADAQNVGAVLVCEPSAEGLRQSLWEILNSDAARGELSRRGREFAVREYSLETMGKRLKSAYQELQTQRHSAHHL